jgi:hypothetical protein
MSLCSTLLKTLMCSSLFLHPLLSADQSLFFKDSPVPKSPPPAQAPGQTPGHRPGQGFPALPKKAFPQMEKPFGMPGVIGFQNGKWEGTDYLGYVAPAIGINVEILKGENIPAVPEGLALEKIVREVFAKEQIIPQAEVLEGPPLPFLHILLIIYPVAKDRYVIYGASRLFEQIQVLRKRFSPAGYWQGITWENQDVVLADAKSLDEQIKTLVTRLAEAFAKRYRIYNPLQAPESGSVPAIPMQQAPSAPQ